MLELVICRHSPVMLRQYPLELGHRLRQRPVELPRFEEIALAGEEAGLDVVGKDQIVAGQAVLARGLEERSEPADAIYPGQGRNIGRSYVGRDVFPEDIGDERLDNIIPSRGVRPPAE